MRVLPRSLLLLVCAAVLSTAVAVPTAKATPTPVVFPLPHPSVLSLVQSHGTLLTACVGLGYGPTGGAVRSCTISVTVNPTVGARLGLPAGNVVAAGTASVPPSPFGGSSSVQVYVFFAKPVLAALAGLRQDVVLHFNATIVETTGDTATHDTPMRFSGHAVVRNCPLPNLRPAVTCAPGLGKRTADGQPGSVTAVGWPAITGQRWQVVPDTDGGERITGSYLNDALLGRHGSDTLLAGDGNDVVWADAGPGAPVPGQRDRLDAGAGNDWVYASAGLNDVTAGAGNDRVFATVGQGKVNCGSGQDVVTVAVKTRYALRNCEKIVRR